MPSFPWKDLLALWSMEIIRSGEYEDELTLEVTGSGWMGYPGAKEEEIAAAEARLGLTFPPSYRGFLKITNGWRMTICTSNTTPSTPQTAPKSRVRFSSRMATSVRCSLRARSGQEPRTNRGAGLDSRDILFRQEQAGVGRLVAPTATNDSRQQVLGWIAFTYK
jgi:hypothetical protein